MPRRLAAIALLSLRAAVRSRLVAALLVGLAIAAGLLPFVVRGDGTPEGWARVALGYSLSLVSMLLGTTSFWAGCAALSQDIRDRQIQTVMTKPVRPLELWLGKWLGLVALNAMLLAAAGIVLYAVVTHALHAAAPATRELAYRSVLTARWAVKPDEEPLDAAAHRQLEELQRRGALRADVPHRDGLRAARNQVLAQRAVAAPGRTLRWTLHAPRALRPEAHAVVRCRITPLGMGREAINGTWIINPDSPAPVRVPLENAGSGVHLSDLPAGTIQPGRTFTLAFENAPPGRTAAAMFSPQPGVEVLIDHGAFAPNLARALAILLGYMALLSAIGLTAGALFSFPVAAFVASSLVIAALLTRFFSTTFADDMGSCGHDHGGAAQHSVVEVAGEFLLARLATVVNPVMDFEPTGRLTDGILIPGQQVGAAAARLVVVYPAVLAGLAVLALRRRELALPGGA